MSKKEKVLISGISGYIGSHCAIELLKKGYHVKGSLRDMSKKDKIIEDLAKIIDLKENLSFCHLDLTSDNNWEKETQDCDYILHIASPFTITEPKDESEIITPAVQGTLRVLKYAKQSNIKKVVITSSTVAMMGSKHHTHITSESWTNPKTDKTSAYIKSKTLAEKAAWDFYQNQDNTNKVEVTVINPGPVFGPSITRNINGASLDLFKKIMTGEMPQVPHCKYPMSDVRDIARIHVEALTNERSNGKRYIATSKESYTFHDIAKILFKHKYVSKCPKVAPSFLLRIISLFDREVKGMLPFVGTELTADISQTQKDFNWHTVDFEKSMLDTAKSVKAYL